METYAYPHFSSSVHVALFKHVRNTAKLKARIVRASTLEGIEGDMEREAVNFAFVDARVVCVTQRSSSLWTVRLSVAARR